MKKKHCKEGRPGSNQMILIHSKVNKLFKKQGTNTLYCFANGHYQTVHPPSLTLIPPLIPTHSHPPKIMPFHRIHVAIKLGRMGGDLGWKKLFKSSYVFSTLAFLVSLCARMFYMLAVLKYFLCLCVCVLLWHRLSYFLCIWKVNFQKSLYRKISLYSKKYLEPTWTSKKEYFAKKN